MALEGKLAPGVLQVIPRLETGGAEQTTIDVAAALVDAGWRSFVASSGGRLVAPLETAGSVHFSMPLNSKNPFGILLNAFRLLRAIRVNAVSIVHARSRAPAWSCLLACAISRTPFVTTYHGAYSQTHALKKLYNSVMVRADAIIANSDWTKKLITSRHPTASEKIATIPRGTDMARFDPDRIGHARKQKLRHEWKLGKEHRIVLQLARLTEWKGHRILIEAAAEVLVGHPDVHIVLAGDHQGRGGYAESLRQLISSYQIGGRVHIVGHCSDPAAAMATAEVAVVPSTEPEAFGRAAVEAEALGTPVIVSDLGAVRETVLCPPDCPPEQRTGWIVPAGDAAKLADAVCDALNLTASQRRRMSKRARQYAMANFSLQQMCDRTLSVYRSALGIAG